MLRVHAAFHNSEREWEYESLIAEIEVILFSPKSICLETSY